MQIVRAFHQPVEVGECSVLRVDVHVAGDVIAVVLLRGRIERRQPDGVDPQPFHIVEAGRDPGQVADPVVVGVGEAADVDLVKDRAVPPCLVHGW